jgi:hypothetical protein
MPPQLQQLQANANTQDRKIQENLRSAPSEEGKHHKLKQMAETLDTPSQSLAFLELYHKSALKVESLSNTLKKVSSGFGIFACLFFVGALFSFMYHSA